MLFWHAGGTIGAVRYIFRDDRMDLRFLVLGALVPDLIDTPLGLAAYSFFGGVRLFAHSLLFGAVLMAVVVVATRRGRPRKRWMPLAIGVLMHLVLDAMWADPETLWWPLLGADFSTSAASSAGRYLTTTLGDWRVWALEVVGAVYLTWLAVRGRLLEHEERRRFVQTGRIAVPIDRR